MTRLAYLGLVSCGAALALTATGGWTEPPPYPGIESWGFRKDLAQEERLKPVPTNGVRFVRGPVAGPESYRIAVAADGAVTITTEDDEGRRRAAYYYQDRVRAGDLKSCVRKPWVRNRIARCFFGPIKRPPLNHDELMDDIDYYPEPYLDRLAHEGVNGLWLTVVWKDLVAADGRRSAEAERRLAKLRRTVDRCLVYGIKTWIFCIEPRAKSWSDLFCTATPEGAKYVEESVRDIFSAVPRLGGILMISHGERPTTCLSGVDAVTGGRRVRCARCDRLEPWQIHWNTASAVVRGIRAAGSSAEYISWFYQPQVRPERAPWVAETLRHLPEGVTLVYNFESGAVKDQLGRFRNGGDYWLSFVGPAQGFRDVAAAGRAAGASFGAKIQVGNSHEVATVPFVPVPGLLYRKYRAMRASGVSTVLQCWYFGNYPGVMNQAAGELSFDAFEDDEETFLRRLAAPVWGKDAAKVADVWKRLSDAYAEYPLSNNMQYYGPFHAGVAWPLLADVELKPLGRTWKPLDAPSGDTIGEALENHTLEEAYLLAGRMAAGVRLVDPDGRDALEALAERWRDDPERLKDIGVMKALACQFESARNIFGFYLDRERAVRASRERGDAAAARTALGRMDAAVVREEAVTRRLLPLAQADSRLGFHSEAEAHQYHPAKLAWRLGELASARRRIAEIDKAIRDGGRYPESDFERTAPRCRLGEAWTAMKDGTAFRVRQEADGSLTFDVRFLKRKAILLHTVDAVGASLYRSVGVSSMGTVKPYFNNRVSPQHEVTDVSVVRRGEGSTVTFTLSAAAWGERPPRWLQFAEGREPLWPDLPPAGGDRLNLNLQADRFGRLVNFPPCFYPPNLR